MIIDFMGSAAKCKPRAFLSRAGTEVDFRRKPGPALPARRLNTRQTTPVERRTLINRFGDRAA
jgi:hypothetical protein